LLERKILSGLLERRVENLTLQNRSTDPKYRWPIDPDTDAYYDNKLKSQYLTNDSIADKLSKASGIVAATFGIVSPTDVSNILAIGTAILPTTAPAVAYSDDQIKGAVKAMILTAAEYDVQSEIRAYLASSGTGSTYQTYCQGTDGKYGLYFRTSYGFLNFQGPADNTAGAASTTVSGQIFAPSIGLHARITDIANSVSIGLELGETGRYLTGDIVNSSNKTFRIANLMTDKTELWSPEATLYMQVNSSTEFFIRYTKMPGAESLSGFGGSQLTFGTDVSTSIFK
jgi:hypothetical protein